MYEADKKKHQNIRDVIYSSTISASVNNAVSIQNGRH